MGEVGVAEEQEDSWRQLEKPENRKIHGDSWSSRRTGRFMGTGSSSRSGRFMETVGVAEEQEDSWR